MKINSKVRNGKLVKNRWQLKLAIEKYEGKDISITIKKIAPQRTNPQNAFYWGVWMEILQQGYLDLTGEFISAEEMHEVVKANCNYSELINEETGEIARKTNSTTGLTITEWEENFKPRVKQWAKDFLNVTLPEPNEQIEFNF